jgi:hypothetical protein
MAKISAPGRPGEFITEGPSSPRRPQCVGQYDLGKTIGAGTLLGAWKKKIS